MMSFLVFYLNYLNRPNPNNKYKTSIIIGIIPSSTKFENRQQLFIPMC